jgi:hypothetical protein
MARVVVKDYDNHTNVNLSHLQLIDPTGQQQSFDKVFAGKAVYLYVWREHNRMPPGDTDHKYRALQKRFEKYPDVVFAKLSVCSDCKDVSDSYRLIIDKSSAAFRSILNLSGPAPFIIGKEGQLLAFKGPKPGDDLLVDYVLYQSRNGIDGTRSGKKLIRGVDRHSEFKSQHLREWYVNHFNQDPDSFDFNFSSTN